MINFYDVAITINPSFGCGSGRHEEKRVENAERGKTNKNPDCLAAKLLWQTTRQQSQKLKEGKAVGKAKKYQRA